MMNIKSKLSEIQFLLFIKLIPDMIHEYWLFSKHVARCNMSKSSEKLLTEILMNTHALEKAFSLAKRKEGFGVAKAQNLIRDLERYVTKYGYSDKLEVSISLLFAYLKYQKEESYINEKIDIIEQRLHSLLTTFQISNHTFKLAGYISKSKLDRLNLANANFKKLASERYSFRHFGQGNISDTVIQEAIDIAKKSPSACNRQGYKVHVFSGEQKNRILEMQGGANSFYKEVNRVILVTGNWNRYYTTEMHLPYIDGSLFAMSLIHAFTFLGKATIPLTLGRKIRSLTAIQKEFNIPENEVLILLIAIGNYPEFASVSMSHRNKLSMFTTFH